MCDYNYKSLAITLVLWYAMRFASVANKLLSDWRRYNIKIRQAIDWQQLGRTMQPCSLMSKTYKTASGIITFRVNIHNF